MQAVLRDRFSLSLHSETRDLPSYALSVAKGGPKLAAPAYPERTQTMNINGGQQIIGTTTTMKSLAGSLSMVLGRPVRDATGLDGLYDLKLDWAASPSTDPSRPSIFTALTEQLGLRLESQRGPVPVFVIEKIERPTEN